MSMIIRFGLDLAKSSFPCAVWITDPTRTINPLRGLLAEFGIVVAQGADLFKRQWPGIRPRYADRIPALAWESLDTLFVEWRRTHERFLECDRRLKAFVREDEAARRLADVPGIGMVTASTLVATVGDGQDFSNGRQSAAWLGLVPRQYSTGATPRLGRITKRGDQYLRNLLVHGARSEMTRTAPDALIARVGGSKHSRQRRAGKDYCGTGQ